MSWKTGFAWVGPVLKVPVSAGLASPVQGTGLWRAGSQTSSVPAASRRNWPKVGERGPWSTSQATLVKARR